MNERAPNVKAAVIRADVGKEADVKAAVDKAVELFGRLDVMVCLCYFVSCRTLNAWMRSRLD